MAPRRIHWHPPGYVQPRARCGAWRGTAAVSRNKDRVTCRRCRCFIAQATIGLIPIRGRPIRVAYRNGKTAEGQLIDALVKGLTICSRSNGKLITAPWSDIASFEYLDEHENSARDT